MNEAIDEINNKNYGYNSNSTDIFKAIRKERMECEGFAHFFVGAFSERDFSSLVS